MIPTEVLTRFEARVDRSGGPDACHPWTGHRHPVTGYGYLTVAGRTYPVHRLALTLGMGREIAAGMCALHHCDNKPCCNPAHLFEGTKADNVADMVAKGRGARGSRHGRTSLSDEEVARFKRQFLDGATAASLGRQFGVSRSTAKDIAAGRTWAHVAPAS